MRSGRHAAAEHEGLLGTVKAVLEIIVFAMFIVTFLVQPFRIPSGSMEPTLRVGDFLLCDKQSYAAAGWLDRMVLPPARVERGDLAVFHFPVDPKMHLVKRVVGVPGDRIRMRGGRVLVNGVALAEPYAFYSPSRPNGFRDEFPSLLEADPNVDLRWWIQLRSAVVDRDVIVPANSYFVLGDNRNDSEDSRYWGFVPRSAIVGRPLLVYFTVPAAEEMQGSVVDRVRELVGTGLRSFRVLR